MSDPVTVHVWLPTGRSLCDRRARRRLTKADDLDEVRKAEEAAPACGSCMLIASTIRGGAYVLYRTQPSVWPPEPLEAIRAMDGTVWEGLVDEADWSDRDWSSLSVGYSEKGTADAIAKVKSKKGAPRRES